MNQDKIYVKNICFEYILYNIINWYKELRPKDSDLLTLTRLKVLKLLFFISAISEDEKSDLLDVFDNFWAMQHGPVESDIYNSMVNDKFLCYSFKLKQNVTIKREFDIKEYKAALENYKERIDNSLEILKKKNSKLVDCSAFDLVEISHKWNSWKLAMQIAELSGKGSEKMNIIDIRSNIKYYSL